jgi:hypothetical protein
LPCFKAVDLVTTLYLYVFHRPQTDCLMWPCGHVVGWDWLVMDFTLCRDCFFAVCLLIGSSSRSAPSSCKL